MKISVIIPCRNEEAYIEGFIKNVQSQDYPKELTEVFFIDGKSEDNTVNIITSYISENNYFNLLINEKKIVPYALNMAIRQSIGDLVVRMDVHCRYPSDYFSNLVKWQQKLNADNVGGVCMSKVINPNRVSISIAKVMSDKFGVGNSRFRIGVNEVQEVDTVPFGCFKKEIFDKIGLFDERLSRCQDIEFNKRLKRSGGKIFLVPEIQCFYIPRETYKSFYSNRYLTGYWIIKLSYLTGTVKNLGLRNFVPLFFLLSLPFTFAIYSVIIIVRSIVLSSKETTWYNIFTAFVVLHVSYGVGSLIGIKDKLVKKY